MCNKYVASTPDFLNLKSDTCPQCGSDTSIVPILLKPVNIVSNDDETVQVTSRVNFRVCVPCYVDEDPALRTLERKELILMAKRYAGVPSNAFWVKHFYTLGMDE